MTVDHSQMADQSQPDDILWRQLKTLPAFRALLRSVESRFYHQIELERPILDLGCGDGHFAQATFDRQLDAGIDPWRTPLTEADKSGAYRLVGQSMGDAMPFPDGHFGSVISNSVLEHIPDVQPALNDASRVLKIGGKLMVTMPSHHFTQNLAGARFFEQLELPAAADAYRRLFNRISRHAHTDSAQRWAERLGQAGLAVERWQYYFSPEALRALEWGHVQGLPAWIAHFLTGHWILAPWRSSLAGTERWTRPFFDEEAAEDGAYLLIVARKVAQTPIEPHLPPPRPFTQAELQGAYQSANGEGERRDHALDAPIAQAAMPASQLTDDSRKTTAASPLLGGGKRLITAILVGLTFMFAAVGQTLLAADPPNRGGFWALGFGLAMMAALAVLGGGAAGLPAFSAPVVPNLTQIERRRWLVAPALLLSGLTPLVAGIHPALGFIALLIAGGVAFAALHHRGERLAIGEKLLRIGRWESGVVALTLFLALIMRLVALDSHPFILNGIEASIGLDARRQANLFGSGWLTNPSLSIYLQALPTFILGQTAVAIRLFSALAGALGVAAIYFIGRRLWGQGVGLAAAILLAGSHVHLHYSRLGMTNIWEPLVMTLAFGSILLAWRRGGRLGWLIAGICVGITPYFYGSAHLFPLMLIPFLGWGWLADRARMKRQWRHLLAAALLALTLAAPQLLFYRGNADIFMERVKALGVRESGWLMAEAERTGLSTEELWGRQAWKGGLAFTAQPDVSLAYKSGRSILSFVPAFLFLLGAGMALWGWRQARQAALLIWLATPIIFAAIYLLESPSSHRLLLALPAACLLAAQPLVWLGERLADGFEWKKGATLAIVLLVAGLIGVWESGFYFGAYRTEHRFADRNSEIGDGVGHYLADLSAETADDWTIYFHGAPSMYATFPTISYLAPAFSPAQNLVDVLEPTLPALPAEQRNVAFVFVPERSGELSAVREAYPGGFEKAVAGNLANPLFFVYEIRR